MRFPLRVLRLCIYVQNSTVSSSKNAQMQLNSPRIYFQDTAIKVVEVTLRCFYVQWHRSRGMDHIVYGKKLVADSLSGVLKSSIQWKAYCQYWGVRIS